MSHATAMIETYPKAIHNDRRLFAECIDACDDCAQACTACADACLGEDMVGELVKCIRSNLDCADICSTTARVLSRHTGYDANITRTVLTACIQACEACGDECERHSSMQHCAICAEACRRCERACRAVMAALA